MFVITCNFRIASVFYQHENMRPIFFLDSPHFGALFPAKHRISICFVNEKCVPNNWLESTLQRRRNKNRQQDCRLINSVFWRRTKKETRCTEPTRFVFLNKQHVARNQMQELVFTFVHFTLLVVNELPILFQGKVSVRITRKSPSKTKSMHLD